MTERDQEAEFARAYPPLPITWEQYMAEGYLRRRFDILDGVRYFYTNTMSEAEIKGNLTFAFFDVEERAQCGQTMHLCFDVLIRRDPISYPSAKPLVYEQSAR